MRFFILLSGLTAMAFAADSPKTIVVVRHAERAGGTGNEVGISEAGRCRAGVLARMFSDAGVTAIYATDVPRTQQTAEPLAAKLNLRTKVIPAKQVDTLVKDLRATSAGTTAVVIGHSNTVPEIVQSLTGTTVAPIADTDYDNLFVVTLSGKDSKALRLHYPGCSQ